MSVVQKGKLYFLIGIARSGKSTIADNWVNNRLDIVENSLDYIDPMFRADLLPRVVVCADRIRLAMGHRWNGIIEPHVAAVANTMIRALLYDHDVLIDETHTTATSIGRTLQIDPTAKWYYVKERPEVCIERAIKTKQDDLIPVIKRMENNLLNLCDCDDFRDVQDKLPWKIDLLRQKAVVNKKAFERIDD